MQSAFDIFFANGLPQNDLIAKFSVVVPTEMTVCSNDSFPEENGNKHCVVKYFCLDCWKALCVECCRVHFKTKVTEQHKLRPIANIDEADISTRRRQLLSHCSLHTNEKLVILCRQCQDVICSSCFAGYHAGHDCVELKTIDEEIVQELRKEQEEVLQRKVDVSKQMHSIERKISAVDNNKSEKLFEIQEHVAKLRGKAHEAYMKIIAKINDIEEEAKNSVLEEAAKNKKCLLPLKDSCAKKMNKLHQINSAFDIILNPSTPVVEQCQFSTLWLDSEILPPICSEVLDPAVTSEIKLTNLVYVPVRVNCDKSSSEELQVEAMLSVPQSPLRSHENEIGIRVLQNFVRRHSVPLTNAPVAVPGQFTQCNAASQPIPIYGATTPNFYSLQQMYIQQVQYQPGATPRMPTPAQYQMTPNMQKAQQQQPVYTQYQQAMTVGQQQQQVPQYASQQVPVVATATTPVLQFHPSASQPTQQKRECKPLLDVNPESGGAVNIDNAASAVAATQQQTSEKSTPQPTPLPPSSSAPTPPNVGEIQAQFVTQVAARMREPSQSEGRNAQGRVPTAGSNVSGSESKPQDTASSLNLSCRSSEKAWGDKNEEVFMVTGQEVAKELTPAPARTTTVRPRAARSLEPRTVVRCTYAEGQWSPSNPKGKKCYSVEFLLQFKDVNYQRPLDLECIPGFIARPDDFPLYRTMMCRYLKACTKGDEQCRYAHKPEDLRPKPKWIMCRNVENTGNCERGDMCGYAHSEEEMNKAIEARREMQQLHKITEQTMVDDSVCLRPGGAGGGSGPTWMKGALGSRVTSVEKKPAVAAAPPSAPASVTTLDDSKHRRLEGRDSSREGRVTSVERKPPTAALPSAPTTAAGSATKRLSEDELRKQAKLVLDEYLQSLDMKEAMQCLADLGSAELLYVLVSQVIAECLERSPTARQQGGQMLNTAVRSQTIPMSQFIQGLSDALQFWQDMEIDIPKFWQYVAETVSPVVEDGTVALRALTDACQSLLEHGKAAVFFAELLHTIARRLSTEQARDLWVKSGIQWSELRPSGGDVQRFLQENKLEFTDAQTALTLPPGKLVNVNELRQVISTAKENDSIFEWIESHVSVEDRSQPPFVRDLTLALCSAAITGNDNSSVNKDIIKKRSVILRRFLEHKTELQLQALYSLQALVHGLEYPQGMLLAFFDTLYHEDVITDDAYFQWEQSNDPQEQNGRGAAKMSVVQFIGWLKEADDEADN